MKTLIVSVLIVIGLTPISIAQPMDTATDSLRLIEEGRVFFLKEKLFEAPPDSNIYYVQQALPFFIKAKNWSFVVNSYNHLSVSYALKNDLKRSEEMAYKARDIASEKLGKENSDYANAVFNIITVLDIKGFAEAAIDEYLEIIALDKKLGTPKEDIILSYQNLATAYVTIGDYESAIDASYNTLRLQESLKAKQENVRILNQVNIGGTYSVLADSYKRKKDDESARTFLYKSLKILSEVKKDNEFINQVRYNCFYKLAEIYFDLNQQDSAYHFAQQAVQIQKNNNVYDGCFGYAILGKLQLSESKEETALNYFDEAIKIAKEEAANYANYPNLATAYRDKGQAYFQLGQYDNALAIYQKGLQITAIDFDESEVYENPSTDQIIQKLEGLNLITGKAKAYFKKYQTNQGLEDDLNQAYRHYLLAADLIQSIRNGYNTVGSKYILARQANAIYEAAIEVSDYLFQKTKDQKILEQAFVFAESNKAITLLETINNQIGLNASNLPDSLLKEEKHLSFSLSFEGSQLANEKAKKEGADEALVQAIETRQFELKEQYDRLIYQIEKDYPEYFRLKYANKMIEVSKIQTQLLDQTSAMIEYFVGTEFIYIFSITKDDLYFFKVEKTDAFNNQIKLLKQTLGTRPESENFIKGFANFTQQASALYTLLLEKPLQAIPKTIDHLVIIPDDIIGFIPFDVLLTQSPPETMDYSSDNLSYLMNRFFVSYGYSGTLLSNKRNRPTSTIPKLLAFAPSFRDDRLLAERTCDEINLSNLDCSIDEVQGIHHEIPGKIVKGEASTKTAFLQEVANYSIVHLATHACVNEDNPMLSRIHFADDYLTLFDLNTLRINSDMVVLSACNTGAGEVVKGEGVISLSRGFMQAGAASTLMSLWAVDDCTTSKLMTAFYQQLRKGNAKQVALQQAKFQYLDQATDKAKAHPYYWAAFVPFGDMEALPFDVDSSSRSIWFISALIFLIGIGLFVRQRSRTHL